MFLLKNHRQISLLTILCVGIFLASSLYAFAEARDLPSDDLAILTTNIEPVEPALADIEPAVASSRAARIDLSSGRASTILTEQVAAKEVAHYLVSAERGQELHVALDAVPVGVFFSVYGIQDRQAYKPLSTEATEWSGILPTDQEYLISVAATDERSDFALFLELTALSPFAKLEPAQFRMPSGKTAGVVSGQISADTSHRYVMPAKAGDIINLELKSDVPGATFGIQGVADGRTFKWLYDESRAWSFVAPDTQDYLLTVSTDTNETDYALTVTMP